MVWVGVCELNQPKGKEWKDTYRQHAPVCIRLLKEEDGRWTQNTAVTRRKASLRWCLGIRKGRKSLQQGERNWEKETVGQRWLKGR